MTVLTGDQFHKLAMRTAAPADNFFPGARDPESFFLTLFRYVMVARDLDRLKSALIYGKIKDEAKFDKLPNLDDPDVLANINSWATLGKDPELLHAVLGISSEAGELAEHLLWIMAGKDAAELTAGIDEETGDIDWFQELLATRTGIPVDHSRTNVIVKLQQRYKDKYTQDEAVTRNDKIASAVMPELGHQSVADVQAACGDPI